MAPKVLIVLTSQSTIPGTTEPAGWYLPEFAHPWHVLKDKVQLVIASPKGGEALVDHSSVERHKDSISSDFFKEQKPLWTNTQKLSDQKAEDFDAIFYVGGHGPMFDLHSNKTSIDLVNAFSSAKKPLAAICHGPTVFIKATNPSGKPLLESTKVTAFSNEEEDLAQKSSFMPFKLETELDKVSGGGYTKAAEPWGENVVVSHVSETGAPLITGQNPASAIGVGKEILKALGLVALFRRLVS